MRCRADDRAAGPSCSTCTATGAPTTCGSSACCLRWPIGSTAEGIDFVVLKGPALAHTRYRDPSLRLFADLDLLVRSGQVDRRLAPPSAEPARRPPPSCPSCGHGFDDRFGKEVMLRTPATADAPDGFEIDLHRTLIAGALGLTIPLDELFARHRPR